MYTVFIPSYLNKILGIPVKSSLGISVISLIFLSVGVSFFGRLSDLIGHEKQFSIGCIALIILEYPTFKMLAYGSEISILIALILLGSAIFLSSSPIFAMLVDSYPIDVRFSGVSIAFNTSMSIFGSTAPMIAFYLIKITNDTSIPWMYIAFSGVLGITCLVILKRFNLNADKLNELEEVSFN